MFLEEETSMQQGLLNGGPSSGNQQPTNVENDLKDIVVDNVTNVLHESTSSKTKREITILARPLNVADEFEIVSGVPTFVWRNSNDKLFSSFKYAISFDNTRIAIQEGWHKICFYNMLDNFSLVAEWEDYKYEVVSCFTFHNNQNNEFVVVFKDSTIALMELEIKSINVVEQAWTYQKLVGKLNIKNVFHILEGSQDSQGLHFHIDTYESETWVCAWDTFVEDIINLCSITLGGFRKMQIKSNLIDWNAPTPLCAISQKAIVLVKTNWSDNRPLYSRIWHSINFERDVTYDQSIEIIGKGLGFSDCGCYLLNWKNMDNGDSMLELYELRKSRKMLELISNRSIGQDVTFVRGLFLKRNSNTIKELKCLTQDCRPLVSYLVAKSNEVKLLFWDPFTNNVLKEMNVTMDKMELFHDVCIGFCISSNVKWASIGCENKGTIGLFHLSTGILTWTARVKVVWEYSDASNYIKVELSSTRLMVNARGTMYVFFPSCLIEDYQLEFQSLTVELTQYSRHPRVPLQSHYQMLIPKQILKKMLILQHDGDSIQVERVLDIANSMITSNVAVLFGFNDELMVVQETLETMQTRIFGNDFNSISAIKEALNRLPSLRINELLINNPKAFLITKLAWIFLYNNEEKDKDLTMVFWSKCGLFGLFIDFNDGSRQDPSCFSFEEPFALTQNKKGNKVSCLFPFEVKVIDLKQKLIIHNVPYMVNLAQWLGPHHKTRNDSFLEISNDGDAISIGWDKKTGSLLALTSKMDVEECTTMFREDNNIILCYSFLENFKTIAYLEFTEEHQTVSSVCIYNVESESLKKIDKTLWNLHTRRILSSIDIQNLHEYTLHLDETNGHLWIIAIHKKDNVDHLLFMPINIYSFDGCVPCLYMQDYPSREVVELEELASKFRVPLFNMLFNGRSNFQLALDNKDDSTMIKIVALAKMYGSSPYEVLVQSFGIKVFGCLLKDLIEDRNELGIECILDVIKKDIVSFEDCSSMVEQGFKMLWICYQSLLQQKIIENAFVKQTCNFEVPIDILTKEENIPAIVGTTNFIPNEWEESSNHEDVTKHWRRWHARDLRKIEQSSHDATTITAIVTLFKISNVCKVGLTGILRFLLMLEAPPYIFKTPLLKWVIEYKWHKIWRKYSKWDLVVYFFFVSIYTIYSIWFAFSSKDLEQDAVSKVCLTILLFIVMIFALMLTFKKYVQMKTYIVDGKILFPNVPMWGLQKFFNSPRNELDLLSYCILILIIPPLHVARLFELDVSFYLAIFIALETILLWNQVWYFAQIFRTTQPFVLMIKKVIEDCIPFLFIAFIILTGFSLTLFGLFQQVLHNEESKNSEGEENETRNMIKQSFGDPWKGMVTLFYAIIGAFQPEMYYNSGSLSPFITMIFVLYLSLQVIVLLNTIIAAMGDTYDKVKATEKELLLMERAKFVDACEKLMSKRDIESLEKSIGKYLYVLLPKDEDITDDMRLWQGRVKTIEDKVGKMIRDSENKIMKRIEENKEEMRGDIIELMKMKGDVSKLKEMKEDNERMKEDINEIKQMLRSLIARDG
eukprot:g7446.t1